MTGRPIAARRAPLVSPLEAGCWLVAIVLGAVQAWIWRFQPSTMDAVSYLDVGDAYARGHWKDAINGYWNPLYSWILGGVMAVVRPSAKFEYPTAKLVDFVIYLLCLCSFAWLLGNIRRAYGAAMATRPDDVPAIPDWVWIAGGYTLFVWSAVRWVTLSTSSPDMAGMALAYCAWTLVLRLERGARRADYPLLGLVLALSYFARTPMFIVAVVVLLLMGLRAMTRDARRGMLVAAAVFFVVTLPFIVAMSRARGHVTIGDNGALNHAWLANPGSYIVPNRHWQGGPSGYGVPVHPSRILWNSPRVYEFDRPIGGTFPPWTDPSYWYEGLTYHFDGAAEWLLLKDNSRFYDALFGRWLLVAFAATLLVAGDVRSTAATIVRHVRYAAPAVTGIAIYWMANDLWVQDQPTPQPPSRYVAVYVVLLILTLAASIRFRPLKHPARARWALMLSLVAISVGLATRTISDHGIVPLSPTDGEPWQVARDLQQTGVAAGMRVATIGSPAPHDFWARLARVRIVAEVPNMAAFWAKPAATQQAVLQVLGRAGVEIVVSDFLPPSALLRGWHRATFSGWGIYRMNELSAMDEIDRPQ